MGKKKEKNFKTNAVRIVEGAGIPYELSSYDASHGFVSGIDAAQKVGIPVELCYKTLVTEGADREYFVFVIPAAEELDLKKAARHFGEKRVEMIHVKDINKVTGYIKGGCSPVGMKKLYRTAIDQSAEHLPEFYVSAGKVGEQMKLDPRKLAELVHADFADLIKD